jgi:hypothetical protein
MRKLTKPAATLGGIAVASTIAFGLSVAFAPSAQAHCTVEGTALTCPVQVQETAGPHKNWTTTTTTSFTFDPFNFPNIISLDTTSTNLNPAGKAPKGQNK